ncbi:LysR substrate-binding domain-containing protein [Streptomyces sp. B21-108]|uniref:LysR substrate-binding domain-containing protein n=1 Tax=Streptomyces sp. B21-108 TaxID=3039419 RepID=UPI003FA7E700
MAKQRRGTLRDLAAHPLVCMSPGTGLRPVFDRACAAQSLRPAIALEASAADAMAGLAVRGLGVLVLSASSGRARTTRRCANCSCTADGHSPSPTRLSTPSEMTSKTDTHTISARVLHDFARECLFACHHRGGRKRSPGGPHEPSCRRWYTGFEEG